MENEECHIAKKETNRPSHRRLSSLRSSDRRGLVTKENAEKFWRLQFCDHNGEFIDREGRYR